MGLLMPINALIPLSALTFLLLLELLKLLFFDIIYYISRKKRSKVQSIIVAQWSFKTANQQKQIYTFFAVIHINKSNKNVRALSGIRAFIGINSPIGFCYLGHRELLFEYVSLRIATNVWRRHVIFNIRSKFEDSKLD